MPSRPRPPSGLRWRLTAWVAGFLLFSAAIGFAVVYTSTGSQITGQIDHEIAAETTQLAQALRPLKARGAAQVARLASRYVRAQPYSVTSTLLFAIVPAAPPTRKNQRTTSCLAPISAKLSCSTARRTRCAALPNAAANPAARQHRLMR